MRRMKRYLHTMYRITDPERSKAFYEALGFRFSRDMDIVRGGELEATNYFFSIGDQENVLELTYNHDGRTYQRRGGPERGLFFYLAATSPSPSTTSTRRSSASESRASSPSASRTACARAVRSSAS